MFNTIFINVKLNSQKSEHMHKLLENFVCTFRKINDFRFALLQFLFSVCHTPNLEYKFMQLTLQICVIELSYEIILKNVSIESSEFHKRLLRYYF